MLLLGIGLVLSRWPRDQPESLAPTRSEASPSEPADQPPTDEAVSGVPPLPDRRVEVSVEGSDDSPQQISALVFSPEGDQLAWIDAGIGYRLSLVESRAVAQAVCGGEVTALAWGDAGFRWLTGDAKGRLRIWTLDAEAAPLPDFEIRLTGLTESVDRVAWKGDLLAASTGGRIGLWRSDGRQSTAVWSAHDSSVKVLRFRQDGKALLSADESGGLKLWTTEGRLLEDFSEHGIAMVEAAGFDPFGWVVTWSRERDRGWGLWREAGGWWRSSVSAEISSVAAFSRDGRLLLWAIPERTELWRIPKETHETVAEIRRARLLTLSDDGGQAAWLEDGRIVLRGLLGSAAPAAMHP